MTEHTNARPVGSEILSLPDLSAELLDQARTHPSHRAARTIHSGTSLRVTVIALAAEGELAEHESPPAATLQVLTGDLRLHWNDEEKWLRPGEITDIPPHRHALTARPTPWSSSPSPSTERRAANAVILSPLGVSALDPR